LGEDHPPAQAQPPPEAGADISPPCRGVSRIGNLCGRRRRQPITQNLNAGEEQRRRPRRHPDSGTVTGRIGTEPAVRRTILFRNRMGSRDTGGPNRGPSERTHLAQVVRSTHARIERPDKPRSVQTRGRPPPPSLDVVKYGRRAVGSRGEQLKSSLGQEVGGHLTLMSRRSRPGQRGFKTPVELTVAAVRMLLGQALRFLEGEEPNRVCVERGQRDQLSWTMVREVPASRKRATPARRLWTDVGFHLPRSGTRADSPTSARWPRSGPSAIARGCSDGDALVCPEALKTLGSMDGVHRRRVSGLLKAWSTCTVSPCWKA
jgi:hypothetical protein